MATKIGNPLCFVHGLGIHFTFDKTLGIQGRYECTRNVSALDSRASVELSGIWDLVNWINGSSEVLRLMSSSSENCNTKYIKEAWDRTSRLGAIVPVKLELGPPRI